MYFLLDFLWLYLFWLSFFLVVFVLVVFVVVIFVVIAFIVVFFAVVYLVGAVLILVVFVMALIPYFKNIVFNQKSLFHNILKFLTPTRRNLPKQATTNMIILVLQYYEYDHTAWQNTYFNKPKKRVSKSDLQFNSCVHFPRFL